MRLIILGSTGSIGEQTLDVVRHLNELHAQGLFNREVRVVGLAAGSNGGRLAEQAAAFGCADVALADEDAALDVPGGIVRRGADAAERLVREVDCDVVMASVVGVAGLKPTWAAVELGRRVAVANKETLVAAGSVVTRECRRSGAVLLPVDSEHSALWQGLMSVAGPGVVGPLTELPIEVERLVLTASGGAFVDKTREEVADATVEAALAHPNWSMGAKVTVDTATLVNKGLELIEAMWLFGARADQLDAVIHRQSIVHSFVELVDGSVMAQLAAPDMRTPIQLALTAPAVRRAPSPRLDLTRLKDLTFEPADPVRFQGLSLARRVLESPHTTSGAILNGANEHAVRAFLSGAARFGAISDVIERVMDAVPPEPLESVAHALETHDRACAAAESVLAALR